MNIRARIRQLKPELFLDDEFWAFTQAHPELPLLQGWLGLWCQADREGRFEWRPSVLKTQILPYWGGDFAEVLEALRAAGLIILYEVAGRRYGAIRSFPKHQRPNNREPPSCIPPPLEHAQAPRAPRPRLPTPDSPIPIPSPTPPPEPSEAAMAPEPRYPGPLQPSRRERAREQQAATLGTLPALKHQFAKDWDPSREHRARGHELGLSDEEILAEAEDCRRKTYTQPFASEDDQFFRELQWLARDRKIERFKDRHERERFENPGRDRVA